MKENCNQFRTFISGLLDGELDAQQQVQLQTHLEACPECRAELQQMKQLVLAANALKPSPPPQEVWDSFLDGVYNRIERKTGWFIFIVGAVVLAGFGVYLFVCEPWGSALIKTLIATPVVGLALIFVSILRERLVAAKTDRYSREIQR